MSAAKTPLDDLRAICINLATQGAALARTMQRFDIPQHRKADTSLVTEADSAVENVLIEQITRQFPDDAIIAEESTGRTRGSDPAQAERFWIIDPIDGTRSFARCLPCFACSVAVADRRGPIAGAVVEAGTSTVFSTAAGNGVWRNDARGQVVSLPGRDLLVGVPSKHRIPLPASVTEWLNKYVVRNYGSAALHLSMVATGILDAALVMECSIWDIAAAGLAVIEGGGLLTDLQGRTIFPMDIAAQAERPQKISLLAGSAQYHSVLLKEIQEG